MSDDTISNPTRERSLSDIIEARYSRRHLLGAAGKLGLAAAFASILKPASGFAQQAASSVSPAAFAFTEIAKNTSDTHNVAPGYDLRLLIRWGDRLFSDAPHFDAGKQSGEAQQRQFGYNNDFIAYLPFSKTGNESHHGLLCVNNEYASTYLMFPGLVFDDFIAQKTTKEQIDVEMAAHGHSVVEINRLGDRWEPVLGSPYNRRITPYETDIALGGPAAGHARMKTTEDPAGRLVRGTFGNCAGGVTPWRSVLVSEENFDGSFGGTLTDTREEANYKRYGMGQKKWYGWYRFYPRYDVGKEPHEANRFGWVMEYDPYDPKRQPVKRTALGRFKHETATTALAPDGRVVVYSGDDERFEYIYRFVSKGKYDAANREKNFGLLDEGTLYVAKFHEDGSMEWLPLVFGQNGLTPANGFDSQGEVLIETRRAADVVGATPMDRPEGIAVHPETGQVFVSLSNNTKRTAEQVDAANTRANNMHGHIIEFQPPGKDHAAKRFQWKLFLRGGNPSEVADDALYHTPVSPHGWLSCPDNLALDPRGNLWIATDGQGKTLGRNDGLYAVATAGESYGSPKLFFTGPTGCEVTGPCFTPDGTTLFLSVQHPGDGKGNTFDNPSSRWPEFDENTPPRPSVVAITKKGGGVIGS